MTPRDWRTAAVCRDTDPELFFPTAESGPVHAAQVAEAKAVCGRCPVRPECLVEAMARIPDGIAGGLTADERHRARVTGRPARSARGSDAAILAAGLRSGARASEARAAGRVLLAAGRPAREVAARCGVTMRTAVRWATAVAAVRDDVADGAGQHGQSRSRTSRRSVAADAGGAGKGAVAADALPLALPQRNALAGTSVLEGHRG